MLKGTSSAVTTLVKFKEITNRDIAELGRELCKTTWNLLSKTGLVAKAPNSINSFFRILARNLAGTRASIGRLGEINRVLGCGYSSTTAEPWLDLTRRVCFLAGVATEDFVLLVGFICKQKEKKRERNHGSKQQ